MSTRTLSSTIARLVLGAVITIATAGCGSELLRTGRSPVYLVVDQVTAGAQGGELTAFLLSDIRTNGSVFNDNVQVTLRIERKNPTVELTAMNSVTLTRYTVEFKRTDGRNRQGIDVPYGFSGGLTATVAGEDPRSVSFELVRHQAKREPPLANLVDAGGLDLLSAIAEITIYGRDQNGNEVSATAFIDVHFGDFGDPA
jgi:hypothetical protein